MKYNKYSRSCHVYSMLIILRPIKPIPLTMVTETSTMKTIPFATIAGRLVVGAIPREYGAVPMADRGRIVPIIRFADEMERNL